MRRGLRTAAVLFVLCGLALSMAWARPGGGSSFGGGGGGSGGGGGCGDIIAFIEMLYYLIYALYYLGYGGYLLFATFPKVAIGITVALAAFVVWAIVSQKKKKPWDSSAPREVPSAPLGKAASQTTVSDLGADAQARRALEKLGSKGVDPNFSLVLFEDFAYALYAKVQEARAKPAAGADDELARLSPYLSAEARDTLSADRPDQVKGVVIGALHYLSASGAGAQAKQTRVRIQLEVNYTEVRAGAETTYFVRELWALVRRPGALSREPGKVRDFGCPSCGAALMSLSGVCSYCKKQVNTGDFDWVVDSVQVQDKRIAGPRSRPTWRSRAPTPPRWSTAAPRGGWRP